jgi:hypothetical protein
MTSETPGNTPTFEAQRTFRDCYYRIRPETSAGRLWNRHLTNEDHQRLLAVTECRTLLRKLDGNDSRAPLTAVYRHYGTAGMWAMLKGVSLDRAVIDVAHRLDYLSAANYEWLLREFGESPDPEDAMEAAIAAGHLVLVESPRTASWNRQPIDVDWHRFKSLWEFFWELSRQAKLGRPLDRWTFGRNQARNVVSNRKNKLKSQPEFPMGLIDLIIRAGVGTQQLNLPPEHIRLFVLSEHGTLTEWRP